MINYNAIPWSVVFFMLIVTAVYILSLRKKSQPTLLLGIYFLWAALTAGLSYTLIHVVSSPSAVYIATMPNLVIFSPIMFIYFAYIFPGDIFPREKRIVLLLFIVAAVGALVYYYANVLRQEYSFDFKSHMYFFPGKFNKPFSVVLLAANIWMFILCVRKTIAAGRGFEPGSRRGFVSRAVRGFRIFVSPPNRDGQTMRSLGFGAMAAISGGFAYGLYVAGIISWSDYMFIQPIILMTGAAVYAYAYLNNSPEPTTFMAKLVGLSLFTMLLVTATISRFHFQGNDQSYDALNRRTVDSLSMATPATAVYDEKIRYILAKDALLLNRTGFTIEEFRNAAKFNFGGRGTSYRTYTKLRDLDTNAFFVAYEGRWGDTPVEVGFSYAEYRRSMHEAAKGMLQLIFGAAVCILLLFPLLFRAGLVKPLKKLLAGIEEMSRGNYSAPVPIYARDEIGFLTATFNDMSATIREHTDELENKVADRTRALSDSLETVKRLKRQQDGDYYLTSRLISPLSGKTGRSERIHVDIFTRQKKKFRYKKHRAELGGDICISYSVALRGKKYLFFTNADAMGKSVQGAGGILVFGAALRSLLSRTEESSDMRALYPEKWLHSVYGELDKLFRTFDGHMMVSAVLGLICEETGFLYFINAEHPQPILLRDGRADFLPGGVHYFKIGAPITETRLQIGTFQLLPEDVLILGSDGKDDVIAREVGDHTINSDERKILGVVETSRGDTRTIFKKLAGSGMLTDDLSLMSLSLHEVAAVPAAEERTTFDDLLSGIAANEKFPAKLLRAAIRRYLQQNRYDETLPLLGAYLSQFPADEEMMLIAARTFLKTGNLSQAGSIAEALLLRNPDHPQYAALSSRLRARRN